MANSMGIHIDVSGWKTLAERIEKAGRTASRMADSVAATTAAMGRRAYTDVLENEFPSMGRVPYTKSNKGRRIRGSFYDFDLGGYRSLTKTTKHGNLRESSFSFETVAAHRSAGAFRRSLSSVRLTSLTANLWEQTTKLYTAHSPFWRYYGDRNSGWINSGEQRIGKQFFRSDAQQKVKNVVSAAIARTEAKYRGELEE